MKIAVGCDPNAMKLKEKIIALVTELGHECYDFGSNDPVYANTAIAVAQAVAAGTYDRGLLFCGTGIGVSIAANKVKGAYAANVSDVYQAKRAELSNHANIITIGAQVVGEELAKCLVEAYLSCTFDTNSRSAVKLERIYAYEETQQ